MDVSDGMDKPWDHPWSTDEMRKKRREWSLAGDAGLLKHLQQFSENLVSKANKTQDALDSLQTQLNETAIFIDNVTNTSLALSNTQFIESRVEEDDIEIEKKIDAPVEESKDQDSTAANFIASVSESVKEGLNIMYEKYKEMEVEDSDSEEEDNKVVLSVVLGPNNPYQDRPLPYVIGSEKWKSSSKIGLGSSSSSSESEQVEEEEESEHEDDGAAAFKHFNMDAASKANTVGSLSSMTESDYSKANDITYLANDKIDVISQHNMDSVSEPVTPKDDLSKLPLPNNITPNFAEELAKRLGTVRQAQKPAVVDEGNEASINRLKDDLFTPEEDENVVSDNAKSICSENKGFLSDQSSENLWKEKEIKPYKNNIIPASVDIPPPISTISTKPKSAIDDLFADAESEDSDDIFSPRSTVKTIIKNKKHSNNSNQSSNVQNTQKKYLEVAAPAVTSNIATSTPETNVNAANLFSDDEDVGDLFLSPKSQSPSKKKPVGGVSILGNILTADVENKLSSRISRIQSSGSSGNDTPANYETSTARKESVHDNSARTTLNDNISDRDSIVTGRNNVENLASANESSYSSGISIQPSSINNTGGSSLGVDFQPQMTSTRLKSEEIYRERVASDSLFTARTRDPVNATSNSNSTNNQPLEETIEDISSIRQDDVFENDDLFGPPPLPKANSKPAKSKVSSLFDDSDSGDELFSTPSSGSRSQKSSDFLTTVSQHSDKNKLMQRRGLFDEEIDIFASKDSPDVDIFGATSKPPAKVEGNVSGKKMSDGPGHNLFGGSIRDKVTKSISPEKSENAGGSKKISLFDDEDGDDGDDGVLFAKKPAYTETKTEPRAFKDEDENYLFSAKKSMDEKQKNDDEQLSGSTSSKVDVPEEKVSAEKSEKRKGSDILSGNALFSTTIGSHGLIFEDDDYDDLFGTGSVPTEKTKGDEQWKSEAKEETNVEESPAKNIVVPDNSIFSKPDDLNVSVVASNTTEEQNGKDVKHVSYEDNVHTHNVEIEAKKSPPKSLDIQSSSPPSEENSQGTKRAVSGKIQNLLGKMGDLKILSPMDTPPLWRRSEEKTDDEDSTMDRDSNDGGCISTQGHSSPPSISEDSAAQKPPQQQQPTISGGRNVEGGISFDEPAQVETLSTTASKTRVRIQAKRRPQSRHARKSAIRQSGIDFDTVDTSKNSSQGEGQIDQSSSTFNEETSAPGNVNAECIIVTSSDRLIPSNNDNLHHTMHQTADANIFLTADDKSEIGSISKESSMSANKNTLLSPSTDEEDLFDVPPDLPEDPQKEDTLFGRAPILSPVEKVVSEKPPVTFKPLKDTHIKQIDDVDTDTGRTTQKVEEGSILSEPSTTSTVKATTSRTGMKEYKDESQQVIDPLRDSSHDPLKDPSQLFAFVTKTPSPEKGKSLLFSVDDSLFSSDGKKIPEEQTVKKRVLDLFADDAEGDLFSASLAKPVKKPLTEPRISLFDEDDEDDSLFGPVVKTSSIKRESERKQSVEQPSRKISLFDDDDNGTNLFSDTSEPAQKSESGSIQEQSNKNEMFTSITEPVRTSYITDIFADRSSIDDNIFGTKSVVRKPIVTSKSPFPSAADGNDNDDNIFGTNSTGESHVKLAEARSAVKKTVTRDLKKTAKKIGEDPLSVLLDD